MAEQEQKVKYPYIRAWGEWMGSYDYYIVQQTELAQRENAPATAIYKGEEGWKTVEDVQNPSLRLQLDRRVVTIAQSARGK